jgi:putative ABC transport system permease protein
MQDRSNVVIIGVDVKQALFPYEDPLDKEVRINGNPFRIIGVMEPLGQLLRTIDAITQSSFRSHLSTSTIPIVLFRKLFSF